MKVGIIGVGRMGSALVKGFLKAKALETKDIIVSDRNREKLDPLSTLGVRTTVDNAEVAREADVIIIAVKPKDVESVLADIKNRVEGKIIISIAAGITTKFIEEKLAGKAKVVRVMPNIGCSVQEGASVYCLGTHATEGNGETVKGLFESVGMVFALPETLMDAVTGLSGSGPAFYYFIMKAFTEAGVKEGIPRNVARRLVAQVAKGAGEMALATTVSFDELIDMVRSPEGTTAKGLEILEKGKVGELLKEAVKVAAKRSRELSR